jgi:predicted P-loop ATPase
MKTDISTLRKLLRCDSKYRELRFNTAKKEGELSGAPFGEGAERAAVEYLSDHYGVTFSLKNMRASLISIAKENSYNPIEEYVTGTAWDGVLRFNSLLTDVLGAPPSDLDAEYLRCFMVGAVARQLHTDRTGVKLDTALILHGRQGCGRTTFFNILANGYYGRTNSMPRSLGAYRVMDTSWIVEWENLDAVAKRSKQTGVLSFLSCSRDLRRKPHTSQCVGVSRRSVFVGTTHTGEYLSRNHLHNRRFWVVNVPGKIDTVLLESMLDQLWAEAVHLYRSGKQWWLDAHFIALRGAP